MKRIEPYKNFNEAIQSLDNGGRFYNLLTKADDGIISKAELGKVGGVFNNIQKMILFLELAASRLNPKDRVAIIARLDSDLKNAYEKYQPQRLLASEANALGIVSCNAIVTGVPKHVKTSKQFNGFILIPVSTGKVTAFTVVPLIEKYDVYEIRDELSDSEFLIAHARGSRRLPEERLEIAGIIKELKASKTEEKGSKIFLEALYHMACEESV